MGPKTQPEDCGHGNHRPAGTPLVEILEQRGHDVVPSRVPRGSTWSAARVSTRRSPGSTPSSMRRPAPRPTRSRRRRSSPLRRGTFSEPAPQPGRSGSSSSRSSASTSSRHQLRSARQDQRVLRRPPRLRRGNGPRLGSDPRLTRQPHGPGDDKSAMTTPRHLAAFGLGWMTSMPSTPERWTLASRSPIPCATRSGGSGGSCFVSRVGRPSASSPTTQIEELIAATSSLMADSCVASTLPMLPAPEDEILFDERRVPRGASGQVRPRVPAARGRARPKE